MLNRAQAYEQFAVWLQRSHPEIFSVLLAKSRTLSGLEAIYRGPRFRERSRQRFGDYADYASVVSDVASTAASDVVDVLPEITVTADAGGGASLMDAISSGPSLADQISAQTAIADALPIATPIEMNVPSDVANAIPTAPITPPSVAASSVAQTLAQNANLIQAVTSGAAQIVTSREAAQVIQAQAQRAAAGLAPANVSYIPVTDSSTGIVSTIPVLNTGTGQLPLSTAGINALAPATFLQKYGLYIMLGLAGFVLAME